MPGISIQAAELGRIRWTGGRMCWPLHIRADELCSRPWKSMTMTAERFPVEASHVMMFAGSIGDTNPAYLDPHSPLIPRPDEKWFGSASGPGLVRGGGELHADLRAAFEVPQASDTVDGTEEE